MVIESTEKLLNNPNDYNARSELSWAATQALNGSTTVGVEEISYPNHMIEHSLSAIYNVPHGAGLSVIMLAWMKWYYKNRETQFERFANKIFGKKSAIEGIEALENWFVKLGTPTKLSQFDIEEKDLDKIANNANQNGVFFGLNELYTEDIIKDILKLAL